MLKHTGIVMVAAVLASVLSVIVANSLGVDEAAVIGGSVGGAVAAVVAVQLARKKSE